MYLLCVSSACIFWLDGLLPCQWGVLRKVMCLWEWGWILLHVVTAQLPAQGLLCRICLTNHKRRARKKAQLGLPFPGWDGSPEGRKLIFWLNIFDMRDTGRKSSCIPHYTFTKLNCTLINSDWISFSGYFSQNYSSLSLSKQNVLFSWIC